MAHDVEPHDRGTGPRLAVWEEEVHFAHRFEISGLEGDGFELHLETVGSQVDGPRHFLRWGRRLREEQQCGETEETEHKLDVEQTFDGSNYAMVENEMDHDQGPSRGDDGDGDEWEREMNILGIILFFFFIFF